MVKDLKLGDLLVQLGLLTDDKLQVVMAGIADNDLSGNIDIALSTTLIGDNYLSKDQLIPVLEYYFGTTYIDLSSSAIEPAVIKIITEKLAKSYQLIPFNITDTKIMLAMADPRDIMAQDDIHLITGLEPEVYFAFWDEIERVIRYNFTSSDVAEQAAEEISQDAVMAADEEVEEDNSEVNRAPVVRLINSIFEQAVRVKASDIHIEPLEKSVKIRLRIDGDLREMMTVPKSSHAAVIARIKIMSRLDIAEKRVPQDGRIEIRVLDKPIDLRVSLLPTVHGEKAVLRLLDRANIAVTKERLGFTPHNISLFDTIIKSPEGIVLVSGPTGSGKTTTLYTVLRELNKPHLNIITVEDPVEYRLDGIHQVQVNPKTGLTFATGLRSILRQDPDIIMVGEIRDTETASIAVRAAITGHVVLSTIHTNDTVSTIFRLIDMGIETYMVSTALVGVIAQRLVKRICTNCRTPHQSDAQEMVLMGVTEPATVYHGTGCNTCNNTGYAGRIAIHEVLALDKELRSLITRGEDADSIKVRAREKSLRTLNETCKELVLQGITTVDEMVRVTYSIDN